MIEGKSLLAYIPRRRPPPQPHVGQQVLALDHVRLAMLKTTSASFRPCLATDGER